MKKLLISIMMLVIALAACSAGGGTITEETADLPTEAALATVPTATEEPMAEPTDEPTEEPTPEPTDTEIPTITPSPEPTETAEPAASTDSQSVPPSREAPAETGTIPEDVVFPEGAVIIFTQSGGFAGFDNIWVFYADGRVTYNGVEGSPQTPERINQVINELDNLGFFQINYITGPNEHCCDFFYYTLAVQTQDRQNYVSFSDGDPNLPQPLWDVLFLIQPLAQEAQAQ